jgi:TonB family protein
VREKRVVAAISSSNVTLSDDIVNAVRGTPLSFLKSRMFLFVAFSSIIHVGILYILNSIKVSHEENMVIEAVPERFAKLIIERPIPKEDKRISKNDVTGQVAVKKSTEPTQQSQEGKPVITTAQKKIARKKVDAQVTQVEQKVRTVGVLGMLTGVGATAKGPAVADVLGAIGDKRDKFEDLDDALNKMTGLKKAPQLDILDKKLVKSKDVSVSHKEEIDDLIAGVGQAESVNLSKKGDFIIQRPESIEGAASSDARRDNDAINEIVASHKASIRMTYEKFLKRDPSLSGKVTVRFTIAASGSVENAQVIENTTGNSEFEQEILRKLRMWKFDPIPEGEVTVSYPFVFSSSG